MRPKGRNTPSFDTIARLCRGLVCSVWPSPSPSSSTGCSNQFRPPPTGFTAPMDFEAVRRDVLASGRVWVCAKGGELVGLAGMLLDEALRYCRDPVHRIRKVSLTCADELVRFYGRHGFSNRQNANTPFLFFRSSSFLPQRSMIN